MNKPIRELAQAVRQLANTLNWIAFFWRVMPRHVAVRGIRRP